MSVSDVIRHTFTIGKGYTVPGHFNKLPSEQFSINFDFTEPVGMSTILSIVISSDLLGVDSTSTVINGSSNTDRIVTISLKSGTINDIHDIKAIITCVDDSVYTYAASMHIVEPL